MPPAEEIEAYQRQVILPAFEDALALARTGNATRVVDALGEPADFFADIDLASRGGSVGVEDFKTAGAREWLRLQPINQHLLAFLDEPGLTVDRKSGVWGTRVAGQVRHGGPRL